MRVEIDEDEARMLAVWRRLDGDVQQQMNKTMEALAGPEPIRPAPLIQGVARGRRAYWIVHPARMPLITLHGSLGFN